jgi:hypothetical protein
LVRCSLCIAATAAAPSAVADPDVPELPSPAEELTSEGALLYRRGDYQAALERFERASALSPTAMRSVHIARCLAKLGRLVAARERYLAVARQRDTDPEAGAANETAQRELAALSPRIPKLVLVVEEPRSARTVLTLDGQRLAQGGERGPHLLDPGAHEVRIHRGVELTARHRVTLAEGEQRRLVLRLPAPPATARKPPSDERGSAWRLWTNFSFGVGAGALLTGIGNGLAAIRQQSALLDRCPARVCPPERHQDADLYDVTRIATTVSFVIGGVGLASGTLLVILAPDVDSEAGALEAGAGPGGAVLRASF